MLDLDDINHAISIRNHYRDDFNEVNKFFDAGVSVWISSHMPLYNVNKDPFVEKYELPLVRDALYHSLLFSGNEHNISKMPVALSGHLHRFQLIDPNLTEGGIKRPIQYVNGTTRQWQRRSQPERCAVPLRMPPNCQPAPTKVSGMERVIYGVWAYNPCLREFVRTLPAMESDAKAGSPR